MLEVYRQDYIADGLTDTFAYNFTIFNAEDVKCSVNGVLQENTTVDTTNHTITLAETPPSASVVSVYRMVEPKRTTDLDPSLPVSAEQLNTQLQLILAALHDIHLPAVCATELQDIYDKNVAYIEAKMTELRALISETQDYGYVSDPVSQ